MFSKEKVSEVIHGSSPTKFEDSLLNVIARSDPAEMRREAISSSVNSYLNLGAFVVCIFAEGETHSIPAKAGILVASGAMYFQFLRKRHKINLLKQKPTSKSLSFLEEAILAREAHMKIDTKLISDMPKIESEKVIARYHESRRVVEKCKEVRDQLEESQNKSQPMVR